MTDAVRQLEALQPQKEFFVGIDSDGCIFDTMEIKHKECFTPQFINHFGMQPVSKYAREAWDFVNLYSKTRGCNRFLAVVRVLELLGERREVRDRNVTPLPMKGLRDWVERETKLGNAALTAAAGSTADPDLQLTLAWSEDVNATVKKIVRNVPPFPLVRESLEKIVGLADAIVCSQTPTEALVREWKEHDIDRYVRFICGQELGTKTQHLEIAARGRYEPTRALMIGDAPGDMKAAKANGFLFYPIVPGEEEASWQRFFEEASERFFSENYAGAYETSLIVAFEEKLPERPPWTTE